MSMIQRMVDAAIEKVGGVYKCAVLLQKRVRELVQGDAPCVKVPKEREKDYIYIALQEVLQDKIKLVEPEVIKEHIAELAEKKSKEKKKK